MRGTVNQSNPLVIECEEPQRGLGCKNARGLVASSFSFMKEGDAVHALLACCLGWLGYLKPHPLQLILVDGAVWI